MAPYCLVDRRQCCKETCFPSLAWEADRAGIFFPKCQHVALPTKLYCLTPNNSVIFSSPSVRLFIFYALPFVTALRYILMCTYFCAVYQACHRMISLKCCQPYLLRFLWLFPLSQHTTMEKLPINIVNKTYMEPLSKTYMIQFYFGFLDFRVGVNEVAVLLGHDVASLGIWFSGFRENAVVSWIALGYFDVGNQTTSDSSPYPRRQDTSRFIFLYLAGLSLSLAGYYSTRLRFMSGCLSPLYRQTLP